MWRSNKESIATANLFIWSIPASAERVRCRSRFSGRGSLLEVGFTLRIDQTNRKSKPALIPKAAPRPA